jgi:hypothetical protein
MHLGLVLASYFRILLLKRTCLEEETSEFARMLLEALEDLTLEE